MKYLKLFIHKRTSFFVNVLFILFILYFATQVGLVTYESLIQWLLILFLYKAMEVEYYGTAELPIQCGESYMSGLTEPSHFVH